MTAFAPGRVNLLGEHTDYNGGLALPFAIARGVTVRATTLPGDWCMVRAVDLRETDDFSRHDPGRTSGWRAFARGTVAELRPSRAVRIEIRGDVPRGGGLSSSAALGCALALALCGEDDPDRHALARLASRVENEWVGAQTGLLDQYASLFAVEGSALLIDFAGDTIEPVPFDLGDWRLAVVRAGSHDHAAGGYNDRRRECADGIRRACGTWRARTGACATPSTPCAPATSPPSARCSTPPTRPCATTSRCPPTRSSASSPA